MYYFNSITWLTRWLSTGKVLVMQIGGPGFDPHELPVGRTEASPEHNDSHSHSNTHTQ